jgi:hypothetical protein
MYKLKLMFEWGGGTVWCVNDVAREKYGVGAIEQKLPLSKKTLQNLQTLTDLHDGALNWDYPPDPSPWSKKQFDSFESKALEILNSLKLELGAEYEIIYSVLGQPSI